MLVRKSNFLFKDPLNLLFLPKGSVLGISGPLKRRQKITKITESVGCATTSLAQLAPALPA